jgi:hypothetical protein
VADAVAGDVAATVECGRNVVGLGLVMAGGFVGKGGCRFTI